MSLVKNISVINVIFLSFMAAGLLFIVLGTMVFVDTLNFRNIAVKGTAIVTNIEEHEDSDGDKESRVTILYTVNNKDYTETITDNSNLSVGKTTQIYYNPNNPEKVRINIDLYILLIFPGMGSLFFIVGLVGMINIIRHRNKDKYLRLNGTRMEATIENITRDLSVAVNDSHPFVINCKLVDMNRIESLIKSDFLWEDPQPIIDKLGLKTLPVYVDRNDSKNYYIDVEQIEKYIN